MSLLKQETAIRSELFFLSYVKKLYNVVKFKSFRRCNVRTSYNIKFIKSFTHD